MVISASRAKYREVGRARAELTMIIFCHTRRYTGAGQTWEKKVVAAREAAATWGYGLSGKNAKGPFQD
jgi:hypothetical protein